MLTYYSSRLCLSPDSSYVGMTKHIAYLLQSELGLKCVSYAFLGYSLSSLRNSIFLVLMFCGSLLGASSSLRVLVAKSFCASLFRSASVVPSLPFIIRNSLF
jgi:hypothetical protein